MSHIQLPYGLVRKSKKIKLKMPKNYGASQYIARLPYLHNGYDPKFQNDAIDSRADLRKFWLATSDYRKNIQENTIAVVTDGRFNKVALRHLLDEKDKGVFKSHNPLSLTFKGAKKFDIQNPVVENLLSQVSASTLRDVHVKKLLDGGEDAKIKARLDALRNFRGGNDDDEDGPGGSGEMVLVDVLKIEDQYRRCLLFHCRQLH